MLIPQQSIYHSLAWELECVKSREQYRINHDYQQAIHFCYTWYGWLKETLSFFIFQKKVFPKSMKENSNKTYLPKNILIDRDKYFDKWIYVWLPKVGYLSLDRIQSRCYEYTLKCVGSLLNASPWVQHKYG